MMHLLVTFLKPDSLTSYIAQCDGDDDNDDDEDDVGDEGGDDANVLPSQSE